MFTLPPDHRVAYLVGSSGMSIARRGLPPYDNLVCDFLSQLSSHLMKDPEAKKYSDVISFAYWCRKANLAKLKSEYREEHFRLGVGLVFHITPSNVPVNFAFSYAISLLAGNANIVRVPSKRFRQVDLICKTIRELLEFPQFRPLSEMTAFVTYDKDDEITGAFSARCDARIIWGGDETVRQIRKLPISERSREIIFPDRYSFGIVNALQVVQADDNRLHKLAADFYNDTYFMDQDACSSPRLLVWIGQAGDINLAKDRFWQAVSEHARGKYELQAVLAVDKYVQLCRDAIDRENITVSDCRDNYVYRIGLNELDANMVDFRGRFGYFYEYETENMDEVAPIINNKYQTLTYFGIENRVFREFVFKNRITGIDRIVPIGTALDISVIWDGYDLIRSLSRIIDIK